MDIYVVLVCDIGNGVTLTDPILPQIIVLGLLRMEHTHRVRQIHPAQEWSAQAKSHTFLQPLRQLTDVVDVVREILASCQRQTRERNHSERRKTQPDSPPASSNPA